MTNGELLMEAEVTRDRIRRALFAASGPRFTRLHAIARAAGVRCSRREWKVYGGDSEPWEHVFPVPSRQVAKSVWR